MQIGVDVAPSQYATWWPKFPAASYTRVFVPPGGGGPTWARPAITRLPDHVTTIGISWKDAVPVKDVVAFVDRIPDGVSVDLTWRHEPEPDWPLDQFRTGWKQLRAAVDVHLNRARIRLVNIHTLWASRHRPSVDWRAWMLPGIADVESWDCYRDTKYDAYEPAESLLGLPCLAAAEFGTRWAVAEFGGTRCTWDASGMSRGQWYLDNAGFAVRYGCETFALWCSGSQTESSLDYRPTDKPTLAAWQAITVSPPGTGRHRPL